MRKLQFIKKHMRDLFSQFGSKQLAKSVNFQDESRIQIRKRQIQQNKRYNQMAMESFPFGKQSIKISEYVSHRLNGKDQQDNARILQQFRRKAIEDKFNNKYGHLKKSKIVQKYITESMLPGVTLNPSIVNHLEDDSESRGQQQYLQRKAYPSRHYTQAVDAYTINNYSNHISNDRRKNQMMMPYYSMASHSNLNPSKITISSEVQTQNNSPLKKPKQKDFESKYYKLKAKSGKKQFQDLEKMLTKLNNQIKYNSKFIENAISKQSKKNKFKRSRFHTLVEDIGSYNERQQSKMKKKAKENQKLLKWKINNQILYNSSTSSSFFEESSNKKMEAKARPKIEYSSGVSRSLKRGDNFIRQIKPDRKVSEAESQQNKDYLLKDNEQRGDRNRESLSKGVDGISKHLRLLKKHSKRLQTLNSYSIVN